MPDSSSITLQVPTDTMAKLDRLATRTQRTHDVLAGEALSDYVDRELAIVEAIERGRAEIRSGEGLSSDDVFSDVEAAVAETAEAKR